MLDSFVEVKFIILDSSDTAVVELRKLPSSETSLIKISKQDCDEAIYIGLLCHLNTNRTGDESFALNGC